MIDLPALVNNSTILTSEEKLLLAQASLLPTDLEIDAIRFLPEIQELTNAFIGDDSTRNTHLQLRAKGYIARGDIDMAWKIILL